MSYEREEGVEQHLVDLVEGAGGMCIKMPSTIIRGLPDRLCLLPGVTPFFVETKPPKGYGVKPHQGRMHAKLRVLGVKVFVPRTKSEVDRIPCRL
jgi:hypothetical protein